jgi:methionyl-tRNA formyltransferase
MAPILRKEDGLIDFNRSAVETWNRLRAFQPWPGAHTTFRGKHLQIHAAAPIDPAILDSTPPSGEIVVKNDRLFVGCGKASLLEIKELQLEGKKRMSPRDFIHGYRLSAGEHFSQS